MTTIIDPKIEARFRRNTAALACVHAGARRESSLVRLSTGDPEFFDETLRSGAFLAFLGRAAECDFTGETPATPDYTGEQFDAEGLSIDEFVAGFCAQPKSSG